MSSALIDFLRTDGVDEGAGDVDDFSDDLSEEELAQKSERLRFDLFNDTYAEIEPDPELEEAPVPDSWVFPVIYKTAAKGDTLRYQIGYNNISRKVLWTVGRVETGGLTLFNTDVVPTRAQKGSFQKKAYIEALNRYKLKLSNGFHRELQGKSHLAIPLPMLANKYRPETEDSAGNVPHMPVAAQAKFDGERGALYLDRSGQIMLLSRIMNPRPHFNHIRREGAGLLEFLPPATILDGELYAPSLGFQLITSIAGSKVEPHPREKELDYFVFDIFHPDTVWRPGTSKQIKIARAGEGDRDQGMVYARASGYTVENYTTEAREYFELPQHDETQEEECVHFSDILDGDPLWVVEVRIALLMNAFRCFRKKYGHYPRHIKLVKTFILHQRSDIEKLFGEMRRMEIGGPEKLEGIMLRHLSRGDADPTKSLYRPGRSDNLLKVKGLHTTEVVITGVRAGKGRAKDLATLVYREPGTGITGTVVPAATHDERRAMLLDPDSVKGRTMTVSFQNRMTSGAMRFPVGVAFVN